MAQGSGAPDGAPEFKSTSVYRELMDRTFELMRDDPEMGPQLRDADTPQRFEFTDLDLVVNIRAGGPEEPNLAWEWSDELRDRESLLPGQGERRDRDRAQADQGGRRREGGARDPADHEAAVREVPG